MSIARCIGVDGYSLFAFACSPVLTVSLYRRISGLFSRRAWSVLFSDTVYLVHARFLSISFGLLLLGYVLYSISTDIRIVVASHHGRPCQVLISVSLAVRYTHQSSHRRRNPHPCIACAMKYVLLEPQLLTHCGFLQHAADSGSGFIILCGLREGPVHGST